MDIFARHERKSQTAGKKSAVGARSNRHRHHNLAPTSADDERIGDSGDERAQLWSIPRLNTAHHHRHPTAPWPTRPRETSSTGTTAAASAYWASTAGATPSTRAPRRTSTRSRRCSRRTRRPPSRSRSAPSWRATRSRRRSATRWRSAWMPDAVASSRNSSPPRRTTTWSGTSPGSQKTPPTFTSYARASSDRESPSTRWDASPPRWARRPQTISYESSRRR